MRIRSRDPLLSVFHVILALGIALAVFVAAMMLIGLGAVLTVGRGELVAELAEAGAPANAYWAVVVVLVLLIGLFGAMLAFLHRLRGIALSVDRGDAFEPANADRLTQMGWITTGAYGIAIAIGAIGGWIERVADETRGDFDVDLSLGGGGILLILTLFVLARVFRQGAAMREELEGTV